MNPNQSHQAYNQQPRQESGGQQQQPVHANGQGGASPRSRWYQPTLESKIVVALVMLAALVVLGSFIAGVFRETSSGQSMVNTDQHQAVFLTNDQVYFGNITKINNGLLVLEDIYYLQVNRQIQPEQNGNQNTPQEQPQVSLAKLGNELHGPEDKMFISAGKVVFWENLKEESQVSQAIQQHKQNQEQQNGQNPQQNSTELNSNDGAPSQSEAQEGQESEVQNVQTDQTQTEDQ